MHELERLVGSSKNFLQQLQDRCTALNGGKPLARQPGATLQGTLQGAFGAMCTSGSESFAQRRRSDFGDLAWRVGEEGYEVLLMIRRAQFAA